jgi:LicD family
MFCARYAVPVDHAMSAVRSKMARLCLFVNVVALVLNFALFMMRFDVSPVSEFFVGESVTRGERQLMFDTFSTLVETFDAANITYFMYGGTLIGSLRHHGIIPWDDDIDVIIAAANRTAARSALSKMSPQFDLYTPDASQKTMLQWKFFASFASETSWVPKKFRWPYVDIFFFEENATHIWDLEPEYREAGFVWPKSSVFPLTRRPFGSFTVPAPCDAIAFVSANYAGAESTSCASPTYNHRNEVRRWHSGRTLPCSHLWHAFPFVFRTKSADGSVIETLKIANWTLQSHLVAADVCSS